MAQGATAAGVSDLLAYYNSIEAIRREGGNRADAWREIQAIQAQYDLTAPNSTIFDMNEVWQRAGAVIAAEAGYAADLEAGALTGAGWAWAPWAAQTTAAWNSADFQIRYQYEVTGPGGDVSTFWGQTDWSDPTGQLPDINDIQSRVNMSALVALAGNILGSQNAGQAIPPAGPGNIVTVQLLRV